MTALRELSGAISNPPAPSTSLAFSPYGSLLCGSIVKTRKDGLALTQLVAESPVIRLILLYRQSETSQPKAFNLARLGLGASRHLDLQLAAGAHVDPSGPFTWISQDYILGKPVSELNRKLAVLERLAICMLDFGHGLAAAVDPHVITR